MVGWCGIVDFAAVVDKKGHAGKVRVIGTGGFATSVVSGSYAAPACGGVSGNPVYRCGCVFTAILGRAVSGLLLGVASIGGGFSLQPRRGGSFCVSSGCSGGAS